MKQHKELQLKKNLSKSTLARCFCQLRFCDDLHWLAILSNGSQTVKLLPAQVRMIIYHVVSRLTLWRLTKQLLK